ncbi:Leukotoxin [Diplonema papillatum]|nr:Leukotoxin [Diplonema papillatum]KAJ9440156.1 Leukotoxin [Diplonema papillatum]KAJ9473574.1 Leukotoxin [Diplonema papillatum]
MVPAFSSREHRIEEVRFPSGHVWAEDVLLTAFAVVNGTAGHDVLSGAQEVDDVTGKKGNDTLKGGTGDDVYVFAGDDGVGVVYDEGGNDIIQFVGVDPDDILLSCSQTGDLIITNNKTRAGVRVVGFNELDHVVETLEFDGQSWNLARIRQEASTGQMGMTRW